MSETATSTATLDLVATDTGGTELPGSTKWRMTRDLPPISNMETDLLDKADGTLLKILTSEGRGGAKLYESIGKLSAGEVEELKWALERVYSLADRRGPSTWTKLRRNWSDVWSSLTSRWSKKGRNMEPGPRSDVSTTLVVEDQNAESGVDDGTTEVKEAVTNIETKAETSEGGDTTEENMTTAGEVSASGDVDTEQESRKDTDDMVTQSKEEATTTSRAETPRGGDTSAKKADEEKTRATSTTVTKPDEGETCNAEVEGRKGERADGDDATVGKATTTVRTGEASPNSED
ncbi:hypothetical protein P7C73_g2542, partial [Tremellales sp. Uapishka_1]